MIATDGKQEVSEGKTSAVTNYQEFLEALKCSGLVPATGGVQISGSDVVFNLKDLNAVDTLVINAAECEPYITTDLRTMLDNPICCSRESKPYRS